MALLDIIQPNNPILRQQALRVSDFGDDLQQLIDDMFQTMLDADGVGIAGQLYVVANPKIIKRSETMVTGVEGCLSLPGLLGDVDRHESIEVTGQDRHGNPLSLKLADWLARVFQHEIDHLDGRLFIDIATKVWRPEDDDAVAEIEA